MIYAKTNPIGLDAVIATVQSKLMSLETLWGVTLDGYPRCYPKYDEDKDKGGRKGIEHYSGKNEYSGNLIHAEDNKFFFTAEDDEHHVGLYRENATIQLFFILNLDDCYPLIAHRCDNEVRTDVKNIINTIPSLKYTTTVKEIEKVFYGYDYAIGDDVQPYHAFRINIDVVQFDINQIYC